MENKWKGLFTRNKLKGPGQEAVGKGSQSHDNKLESPIEKFMRLGPDEFEAQQTPSGQPSLPPEDTVFTPIDPDTKKENSE